MPRAQDLTKNWLWYATRTSDCTPLDLGAYPASTYDGEPVPWPEWACKAPHGGIHASASVSPIHLKIAERPNEKDEISWTCDFAVRLVAGSWIDSLRDLLEEENVALGEIYLDGEIIEDWFTITEIRPPHLLTNRGRNSRCSHCGYTNTVVRGMPYFSDPAVLGRGFIASNDGLFVREDIARSRSLRTPAGAYSPARIRFREQAS